MNDSFEVYRGGGYVLGIEDGLPYARIGGETYKLTCHPYEPCLYITDGGGRVTAVHNSFDPVSVLDSFRDGRTVTSITGREYGAEDFCEMLGYAAGAVDIQIDDAEKVFGGRAKRKTPEPEKKSKDKPWEAAAFLPEQGAVIESDPFYAVAAAYPDSAADYCLVMNAHREAPGLNSHRSALAAACRKLFIDENGKAIWRYDVGKADAKQVGADALFAPVGKSAMNYRKAFLDPPYPNGYTDADFDRVNAALFPAGTDGLEVFEWTTDWSEYFDEGREWWGTLCLTVYDKKLDRFAVIMASATD